MLTEQTRDFEAGRHDRVYAMLRRYVLATSAADGWSPYRSSGG